MTADCSATTDAAHAMPTTTTATASHGNGSFSAGSLSMRVQKNIASKLATRNMGKLFIPEAAERLFDHLFIILKQNYPKKEAEKVVSNMVKLAVKLGLLSLNGLLSTDDVTRLDAAQRKLRTLAITVVSFQKVAYSFDGAYLVQLMLGVKDSLQPLMNIHLSDKSSKRLSHIFDHITNTQLLETLFKVNGGQAALLQDISKDLEAMLEAKQI